MPDQLAQETVEDFLARLASAAPTPGGGSAAALAGALGAALVSMVCNLTIGRSRYVDVEEDMEALLARSEEVRSRLTSLIDADARAFETVSQAIKMPRDTDQDREARTEALQTALKSAAIVPLQIAGVCRDIMAFCRPLIEKGNPNVISDAGVAVLMAEAGLRSAALNVLINLKRIKDEDFVDEQRARLDAYLEDSSELRDELYSRVVDRL